MSKRYNPYPYDWNNRPLKNARTTTTTSFIGPVRGGRNPTYKQRQRRYSYAPGGLTRTGGFYGRFGRSAAVQGIIPEKKFYDTATQFLIDATGEVPVTGQLVAIGEGNGPNQRDGRRATLVSWHWKATLTLLPGANALPGGTTYIYLVLDKQCNGAAAAITDVFLTNSLTTSPLNLENSMRFVILKKWVHDWSVIGGVSAAYAPVTKHIDKFKTCNILMDWNSTTGALIEIKSNNVFLCAGAGGGATIDDLVSVDGIFRFRFRG